VSVFLTGFPGFLGSALVSRLRERDEDVHCLIQSAYREQAESRAESIAGAEWDDVIHLHEGDITESNLGLDADTYDELQDASSEVFHLAAVYDLAVDREVGMAVNVDGTKRVLDFAEGADLRRFQYVSTCYVSGRHDGVFRESDLDVGQSFNNYYEETKFLAEKAVQERMDEIPTTIYRPAIAVGDSNTGETQKYDGPYYVLRWMLRSGKITPLPFVPGSGDAELNVVPRNFVVDAIDHLSALDDSEDTVYQLCDPNPPTVPEMTELLADATNTTPLPIPASRGLTKRLLRTEWGQKTGVLPESVDYFTHPTTYVCPNTHRDLAGSGIVCPPFESYVGTLVEYVREHPEIDSAAMT